MDNVVFTKFPKKSRSRNILAPSTAFLKTFLSHRLHNEHDKPATATVCRLVEQKPLLSIDSVVKASRWLLCECLHSSVKPVNGRFSKACLNILARIIRTTIGTKRPEAKKAWLTQKWTTAQTVLHRKPVPKVWLEHFWVKPTYGRSGYYGAHWNYGGRQLFCVVDQQPKGAFFLYMYNPFFLAMRIVIRHDHRSKIKRANMQDISVRIREPHVCKCGLWVPRIVNDEW